MFLIMGSASIVFITDKQTDVGPNIKKLPDLIRKHSSIMYKSRTLISIRFQQNKNLAGKSLEQ